MNECSKAITVQTNHAVGGWMDGWMTQSAASGWVMAQTEVWTTTPAVTTTSAPSTLSHYEGISRPNTHPHVQTVLYYRGNYTVFKKLLSFCIVRIVPIHAMGDRVANKHERMSICMKKKLLYLSTR